MNSEMGDAKYLCVPSASAKYNLYLMYIQWHNQFHNITEDILFHYAR